MSQPSDASYIQHLESKIADLETQVKQLQEQIKHLKAEKGISAAHEGLSFNDKTGIWANDSGMKFCPKCLDKQKRNPLRSEDYGWRCQVCDAYYDNPDAPPPMVSFQPNADPF